jgi:hypothetical protein
MAGGGSRTMRSHELDGLVSQMARAMGVEALHLYPPAPQRGDQERLFDGAQNQAVIMDLPRLGFLAHGGGQNMERAMLVGHALLDGPKQEAIRQMALALARSRSRLAGEPPPEELALRFASGYAEELGLAPPRPEPRSPGREVGSR